MVDEGDRSIRYRIAGEIARGGMGAVFRGRDPDLGRDVALKVLREDLGSHPSLIRRFVEEAQIGGQLQHPGIVPVYELGTLADHRPFFAMKLVQGDTLARLLAVRAGPESDLPRFVAIFESICQAVAYAHTRGVIHRDLKPANVMVGHFGEVQVMDWGLAKVVGRTADRDDLAKPTITATASDRPTIVATWRRDEDSDDAAALSRPGWAPGTPPYMAPEQARGESSRVDERADVFALGSILCEILTGQPAFTGRLPGDIRRKAADALLDDAHTRLATSAADAELVALARDCLAAEPENRPIHASAVALRVRAHLAGVQDRLRDADLARVAAVARAAHERRNRQWQLGLAATVIGFVILGAALLSRKNADLTAQRRRAEEGEQRAVAAVRQFGDVVAQNPALKNDPALADLRRTLLSEPRRYFQELLAGLQSDRRSPDPATLPRLAEAMEDLAGLTAEIGDARDALALRRQLADLYEQLLRERPTDRTLRHKLANAHFNLGNRYRELGDPDEALARFGRAAEQYEALARMGTAGSATLQARIDAADALNSMATVRGETGRWDLALKLYQQVLEARNRLARENPDEVPLAAARADAAMNLAVAESELGRIEQALATYRHLLPLRETLQRDHPKEPMYGSDLADLLFNIADLEQRSHRPDRALEAVTRSLPIREALVEQSPSAAWPRRYLAMTYELLARVEGNLNHLDRSRGWWSQSAHLRRALAEQHPGVPDDLSGYALAQTRLAALELAEGLLVDALERLCEAMDWHERAITANPQNPHYARLRDEALETLREALVAAGDPKSLAEADRVFSSPTGATTPAAPR
jgi:tetratricopeptide (TPR) repeat protein